MFTKEQLKIIEDNSRHSIIVANAGTGKTTCMIAKIKHLIQKEYVDPKRILMTSFSKVASKELIDKANTEIGVTETSLMSISTIHAIAYKVVMENLDKLNLKKINIVPEAYLSSYIYNIASDSGIWYDKDDKGRKLCIQDVSHWRRNIVEGNKPHFNRELLTIFESCYKKMHADSKLLFDDLLLMTVELLDKYEEIQEEWSSKYQIIIGDEIQDTNKIQFDILEYLIGEKTRTCIVGDVKQNIYAFRGAHYTNMENFRKKYNSTILYLSETFRFNKEFAGVSNKIIDTLSVDDIYKKYTKTQVKHEGTPEFYLGQDINQVAHVIDDIIAKKKEGYSYSDLNIIYRYNKDGNDYIKALKENDIPYLVKVGDILERKEVKFIVDGLRVYYNFSLSNIISFSKYYSDFIGDETFTTIFNTLEEDSPVESVNDFFNRLNTKKIGKIGVVRKKALNIMAKRFDELTSYIEDNTENKINIYRVTHALEMESAKFYTNFKTVEGITVAEEVDENINFLTSLYEEADQNNFIDWYNFSVINNNEIKNGNKEAVQLKTIHGCKGQTLPVVYFIANKMFAPYFIKSDEDVQNEMFVLYVAITRAEKILKVYCNNVNRHMDIIIPKDNKNNYITNNDNKSSKPVEADQVKKDIKKLDITPPKGFRCMLVEATIVRKSEKAILFELNHKTQWLPISRIKREGDYTFVPDWLITANDIEEWMY